MNEEINKRLKWLSDSIFYQCLQVEILKSFADLSESDRVQLSRNKALHLFQSNTMSVAILNHMKLVDSREDKSLPKLLHLIQNNCKKIQWHRALDDRTIQIHLESILSLEAESKANNLKKIRDKLIAHADLSVDKLSFDLKWLCEPLVGIKKIYNSLSLALKGEQVYFDLKNESGIQDMFHKVKFYQNAWSLLHDKSKQLDESIRIQEIRDLMKS